MIRHQVLNISLCLQTPLNIWTLHIFQMYNSLLFKILGNKIIKICQKTLKDCRIQKGHA